MIYNRPMPESNLSSKRTAVWSAAGVAASATAWAGLRGFTGVFEVLNLRVFVGFLVLAPSLMGPLYGSDATFLTRDGKTDFPLGVRLLSGACALCAVLIGEAAASGATGRPVSWDKFVLIVLFVCAVLPFQLNRVFKSNPPRG